SDYIHRIDEAVAAEAGTYIEKNGPDLSWVYLQYTDDMGHGFGNSEKFYEAIRMADKQIGKVWAAIKEREKQFNEDWLIVITTDHGRDSLEGKHHGGQSDRERLTWIVTNADNLNERFKQTPAVVDIMPSICKHLGIPIPDEVKKEMDGVPFIGEADLSDLKAELKDGNIALRWKSLAGESEKAEVFLSKTNDFQSGGKDEYRKVGDVDIRDEAYTIEVDDATGFYKILVKGPNHYVNTWVGETAEFVRKPAGGHH
ncbi:MAG: alkaline phosphatase family protein, partial [Chryseosolibacter sp.]